MSLLGSAGLIYAGLENVRHYKNMLKMKDESIELAQTSDRSYYKKQIEVLHEIIGHNKTAFDAKNRTIESNEKTIKLLEERIELIKRSAQ